MEVAAAFETLGFVGLGAMGRGMASNLTRRSGRPVHVFDAVAELITPLVDVGATESSSVADLGAAADVVFLSLPGIGDVETVCAQLLDADPRPSMVVDMSTCDVRRTRALAARMAEAGVGFVDAPVARMRQAAVDGTLFIAVGATPDQFDALEPLLATMGTDVVHCGSSGAGQVVKIVNNMVVLNTMHTLAEAIAIARTAGMDAEVLVDVLAKGSADSFMLRSPATRALVTDEFPLHAFPTLYGIKDISLALTLAEEGGITARAARSTLELLAAARDGGYEQEYYPVFIRAIEGRL
ncbi:MAG: NAD(P)-dependent oxidoreductase [Acidimicrobiia bacterium]